MVMDGAVLELMCRNGVSNVVTAMSKDRQDGSKDDACMVGSHAAVEQRMRKLYMY